ncbi:MAG: hypothetical protein ABI456_19535 [Ktedonobacteraceae bacterium]
MLHDELRENWAFQEIWQEGYQQGWREGMRLALLAIVGTRFPELLSQVKALMERERDVLTLERLVITLLLTQDVEVAAQSLSNDIRVSS